MSRLVREIAIAGALLLAVTSCSTTTAETTTPTLPTLKEQPTGQDADTATKKAVDPEEAYLEFTECLRENGFDIPDFDFELLSEGNLDELGDPEDYDSEVVDSAVAACGGPFEFPDFTLSPEEETEWVDRELAFAQCMRANGIAYPDPADAGRLGVVMDDREKFNAAADTCTEEAYGDLDCEVIEGDVDCTSDDS